MKNIEKQKAKSNNVEVNHIKNLADCQKEWLINARCTSSDSDCNYVMDRSKRIRNISGNPRKPSKSVLALQRSKETLKSSSSSDDEEGIVIIDRGLMYGKLDNQSNTICAKTENCSSSGSSSSMRMKKSQCTAITDNQRNKSQIYQISIGNVSFDKSEVCILLGDSIYFTLIEAEDSCLCRQYVLTGVHF
jgi:hypothetical protein